MDGGAMAALLVLAVLLVGVPATARRRAELGAWQAAGRGPATGAGRPLVAPGQGRRRSRAAGPGALRPRGARSQPGAPEAVPAPSSFEGGSGLRRVAPGPRVLERRPRIPVPRCRPGASSGSVLTAGSVVVRDGEATAPSSCPELGDDVLALVAGASAGPETGTRALPVRRATSAAPVGPAAALPAVVPVSRDEPHGHRVGVQDAVGSAWVDVVHRATPDDETQQDQTRQGEQDEAQPGGGHHVGRHDPGAPARATRTRGAPPRPAPAPAPVRPARARREEVRGGLRLGWLLLLATATTVAGALAVLGLVPAAVGATLGVVLAADLVVLRRRAVRVRRQARAARRQGAAAALRATTALAPAPAPAAPAAPVERPVMIEWDDVPHAGRRSLPHEVAARLVPLADLRARAAAEAASGVHGPGGGGRPESSPAVAEEDDVVAPTEHATTSARRPRTA